MDPGRYDFSIKPGQTFNKVLLYEDNTGNVKNLTGYRAKMQFRETQSSQAILTLTTENGKLVITGAQGKIEIKLTPEETRLITKCKMYYDMDIYTVDGNGDMLNNYPFIEGIVKKRAEITKNV